MKRNLLLFTMILSFILKFNTIKSQTAGTLTAVFTPTYPAGSTFYDVKKNTLAAWIQSSTGTFIKTNLRFCCGGSTFDHLPTWNVRSGGSTTGATTGATKTSFVSTSFTWDGKDAAGVLVADGSYNIIIESCWNHGASFIHTSTLTVTKGPSSATITPTTTSWLTGVNVQWQPVVATGINVLSTSNPEISIFPNPSKGIFNIDFKQATAIKVFNTLGICIYSENIEDLNENSKSVDLSDFQNGIYVITVFNGNNASNHKIILNK